MRSIAAFLAAALLVIAPCADAQTRTKLNVGYGPASGWMAAFVAKDQGIFDKNGLDVTFQFIPVGSNQPAALISRQIQVAGLTPTIHLFAAEAGLPIQAVAGAVVQTKANPFGAVVAREGSNIKVPADFRGKRVAVPGINSVLHVAFMKWLKTKGIDPRQVTFNEIPMQQMNDVLKGGQVDAAVPVEPFLGGILQSKAAYMVSEFPRDLADPSYVDAYWGMTREFIQANPAVVAAFRASIREGTDWIAKNPQAARKTIVTYLHLPEKIAMSVKLPNFATEVTPQQLQFWIDTCKELGITKGTTTVDQVLAR